MNKRLERVKNAQIGLGKMIREMHDARFDGGDMLISLEDGTIFFIQGFTTRESFDKAFKKAKEKKENE